MRGQLVHELVNNVTYAITENRLEEAATEVGNIYHDWSVRFFRFAIQAGARTNLVDEAMFYAKVYGAPKWELLWKMYAEARLR